MTHSIDSDLAAVKRVLAKLDRKDNPRGKSTSKRYQYQPTDTTPEYAHWLGARTRARQKGLDFDITVDDIVIPEFCPVLGIKLEPGSVYTRPELDRKDVSKGYVKGNVFIISGRANRLKMNATLDEIRNIAAYSLSD